MILYLEYHGGSRHHWVIDKFADLWPIAEQFPQVNSIAKASSDLRDAVDNIADYLSNHSMDAWVEDDEEFNKSIKQGLMGIGMATAMTMSPQVANPSMPPMHHEQKTVRAVPFGQEPEDKFLNNIMQLESSGGKNVNHKPVKFGMQRGQRASGRWGLLKPTVDELVGRMDQAKTLTPEVAKIKGMDQQGMSAYLAHNPHVELYLARYLARHVLGRHHQDARRAAYSWKHGHNLFPADISEHDLAKEPYVNDFMKLQQGQRVRGLQGSVFKAEGITFKERLKIWRQARDIMSEQDNRQFPERNRGIDPGRMITPEEERDLRTKTGNPQKDLGNAIEEAKRARMKP